MLINLSNHPSSNWPKEQFFAAKEYTEIVDIPFPAIDPQLDAISILRLAKEHLHIVLEELGTSEDPLNAVHLMGEMTFTFALVAMLQKHNIKCLASTTKRQVVNLKEGKKTVEFQFVRFREYPILSLIL